MWLANLKETIVSYFVEEEKPFLPDGITPNPKFKIHGQPVQQQYTQSTPNGNNNTIVFEGTKEHAVLSEQISNIEKRTKYNDKRILKLREEAKELISKGLKKSALQKLKMAKLLENENNKSDAQQMNLTVMTLKLESVQMDHETFKAQKEGANAMKTIFGKVGSVKEIEKEQDEIRNTMEDADEFSRTLGEPLLMDNEFDTVELEDELDQLLHEDDPQTSKSRNGGKKVKSREEQIVEEEIAALEREMAQVNIQKQSPKPTVQLSNDSGDMRLRKKNPISLEK